MLDTRDKVIALCNEKGCRVREPYPGFIVAEDFASKCLDVDATRMIDEMDAAIPTVHTGQEIVPGRLQWVSGKHIDLHYRGNELKRRKCWIQDGGTDKNILIYSYTGWNNSISFATSDWNKSTYFKPICIHLIRWLCTIVHAIVGCEIPPNCFLCYFRGRTQ